MRYAGSERCVAEMLRVYPDARLVTTVVQRDALPAELGRAEPSFLQHLPGATSHHEWLLPLMPAAWRTTQLRDVDVVVSSSHACANAVRVAPGIPHLSYCHTPMRYAWDFDSEAERFPALIRPAARVGMRVFRRWDRRIAARIDRFLANSSAVAERIEQFYGRDATVVHPPVRTDYFTPNGAVREGFLFVGRLVPYKRADLAVEAFRSLPYELSVVGTGPGAESLRRGAPPNVRFVGDVDDEELRRLYRAALALVAPGVEDFGIVMAEAQACGTPVLAPDAGGARDIVADGVTGRLFEPGSVAAVSSAVREAAERPFVFDEIASAAQRFSAARFREQIRFEIERTLA